VSAIGARLSGAHNPYLDDRDFIAFQQRGTRYTSPALFCPSYEAANQAIFRDNLGGTAAVARQRTAAAECGKQLVASGVDLDAYDTAAIVADLTDALRALGLPRVALFGVSYGTRVALEAIRAAPRSFEAVVLDSVLPPDVRYDELATESVLAVLDRVLDQCAVEPACARAYPALRNRWTAALDRANRAPVAVSVPVSTGAIAMRFTGRNLMEAVYDALNDRTAIRDVPKLIDAIARGDLAPAARILAANAGPSSMARGQRLSVWCRDEAGVTDLARAPRHPELAGWQTVAFDPAVCKAWPVTPARADRSPVVSDVPVLIIAGEYDPNTPPAWGKRARATLSQGWFIEMPGESHVAGNGPCAVSIARAFLREPRHLPDTGCIAQAAPMMFAVP
jgi:pimeloyl-ACP methyl ester carboxylesterase